MISDLAALVGQRVTAADLTKNDVGLAFSSGVSLAIYNDLTLTFGDGSAAPTLVGMRVDAIQEDAKRLVIDFDGGATLEVSLRDEAFVGPEAMVLRGRRTVVWRGDDDRPCGPGDARTRRRQPGP